MKISTRREAADAGLKRFYTGRPCKNGHDAERFTTTGGCVKCNAARSKLFATETTKAVNARARGQFVYPCHPGDVAALLAYAQGLDLARGRIPFVPPVLGEGGPHFAPISAEQIQADRQRVFFGNSPALSGESTMQWADGKLR